MADHDHLNMSVLSIRCFSDDGRLDAAELRKVLDIVERDGSVNDEEKRVLGSSIGRIRPHELDADLVAQIAAVNSKLGTEFRTSD